MSAKDLERAIVRQERAWHGNYNDGPIHADVLAEGLYADGWRWIPSRDEVLKALAANANYSRNPDAPVWVFNPERATDALLAFLDVKDRG